VASLSDARYVVIGAGVHGLSSAWHLARELRARGRGDGRDILVLDKTGVAAGASGVACGVVRNNYFQPAMRELMAHSVDVWDSDPEGFAYHPVGYMQIAPEVMAEDVATIAKQQADIGYESVLVQGEAACRRYMERLFSDWQARRITAVLHEKRGGYANNVASMRGLAAKAEAEGVRFAEGVAVTGFDLADGTVRAVETDRRRVACDEVVVGAGPWIRDVWAMLDLPSRIDVRTPEGEVHRDVPMWTYWALQEGTLGMDPDELRDNRGQLPPVLHVDSDAPLYDDEDGERITDRLWGIYYKPDFSVGGVQGGTTPVRLERSADEVAIDPYGSESPEFTVDKLAWTVSAERELAPGEVAGGEGFVRFWTSALAHCHTRFGGARHLYRREPTGGIGAFSPDSFPVFDRFRGNCYVIADSNHGYKMLGVGQLVAKELMGERQPLLEPFRFSRYGTGELHPTSSSPFPWS
jgi:glycine/D-amino acid oxidase-like deaminating enzyme